MKSIWVRFQCKNNYHFTVSLYIFEKFPKFYLIASAKSKVFRASDMPENNTEAEIESMIRDLLEGDEKKKLENYR